MKKKIAIVHDHFRYLGGAERVLLTLLRIFPHSDIFLSFLNQDYYPLLKKHTTGKIHVSIFNRVPFSKYLADWFKPLVLYYWESLDLTTYDLVISSSHSFSSKSVVTLPHTFHVSYIHTPPRYLYTEFNESRSIKLQPLNFLLSPLMTWLRMEDYLGAQRPDVLIANSKTVQKRIKKYYKRESTVIYPCINIPQQISTTANKEYFLVVSRLVKQKGIDLAIRACNSLRLPLLIVGEGREEKFLKSIAGPNVTFTGFVSDARMPAIYARAKALLYCSREEDFGLVPVESMTYGVPVIAYKSGAITESVSDGVPGIFFDEFSPEALITAMQKFLCMNIYPQQIRNSAKKFSEQNFINKFQEIIKTKMTS